jgi:hypothetical protein
LNSANSFTTDRNKDLLLTYTYASQINHSCLPNAFRLFVPGTHAVTVYASRDLKPGEQVFLSYGPVSVWHTIEERRQMIQKTWFFDCSCKDCLDPDRPDAINAKWVNALKCANSKCSEPVNPQSGFCKVCSTRVRKSSLDFHFALAPGEKMVPEHRRNSWKRIEGFVKEAESVYHPNSLALSQIYKRAAEISITDPELRARFVELNHKSAAIIAKVFGNPSLDYLEDLFYRMAAFETANVLDMKVALEIGKNLRQLFLAKGTCEEFGEEILVWSSYKKGFQGLRGTTTPSTTLRSLE